MTECDCPRFLAGSPAGSFLRTLWPGNTTAKQMPGEQGHAPGHRGDSSCLLLPRAAPSQGPTCLAFCSISSLHAGRCLTTAPQHILINQMCSAKRKKALFNSFSSCAKKCVCYGTASPPLQPRSCRPPLAASSVPGLVAQLAPDLPAKEGGQCGSLDGEQQVSLGWQWGSPGWSMIAQALSSSHLFALQLHFSNFLVFQWYLALESTKEEQSRWAGWEDVLELCSLSGSHWHFPGPLQQRQGAGYHFRSLQLSQETA